MKILIANGYVRENKGDAALITVLAEQLQEAFPNVTLSISGMEDPVKHPDFYGFKNIGSVQRYAAGVETNLVFRIIRKGTTVLIGIFWPLLPYRNAFSRLLPSGMREELLAIDEADMVVSASGGYLNGTNSILENVHIYYDTLPLRLAQRIGKMVVMAPESFGPFGNDWQRNLVRKTLNACDLVFVREHKSYDLLKEMGVKNDIIFKAVDSGFAHKGKEMEKSEKTETMLIGITARNWLKGDAQKKYERALAGFIINVEKLYGASIILIPQVTSGYNGDDDRVVEERIKNLATEGGANPLQITSEIDHYDIKKMYSKCTFTVGTRFHSVIFSLTSHVPAIAIEYEHKTSGIMQDLGLGDWVIRIEDVTTEKLNTLFKELLEKEVWYRNYLAKTLPDYIARTKEVPDLIQRAYERRANANKVQIKTIQ